MKSTDMMNRGKSSNWLRGEKRENARHHQRAGSNPTTKGESNERKRKKRKVYRKTKVLRMWVLPALFLVPLGMMWVEYSIGKLIDLEDIRDVYHEQLLDPWTLLLRDLNESWTQRQSRNRISPSFLANVSYSPRVQCPPGQRRMINVHNPLSHSVGSARRRIPKIIHQQSRTRCLTMKIDQATTQWAFRRWSYYIHDENSRIRLFDRYCCGRISKCEFPLLCQVVSMCFHNKTSFQHYYLKIELWKFLTLWIFGGIYVDIDFLPMAFTPTSIDRYDDGFLLLDADTRTLSTKMIALAPRHPIMYYAVHQMLLSVMMEESTSIAPKTATIREKESITGSSILSQAFRMFKEGYEVEGENIFGPGIFHGAMNRTVHVIASSGLNAKIHADESDNNDIIDRKNINLITRIFRTEQEKEAEFEKMGMVIDDKDAIVQSEETRSCLNRMYNLTRFSVSGDE